MPHVEHIILLRMMNMLLRSSGGSSKAERLTVQLPRQNSPSSSPKISLALAILSILILKIFQIVRDIVGPVSFPV